MTNLLSGEPVFWRRSAGEWLAWAGALALAALMCVSLVWSERRFTVRAEEQRMADQALIISQNLVRQLAAVRSVLESVRAAIVDRHDGCAAACQRAAVHALRGAMPGVRAIVLADRDGNLLFADDESGQAALGDRRFVASLAAMRAPRTLYLSAAPARGPAGVDVKAAMPLGLPGRAAGQVLIAVLDPAYFDVVMRSALYAPDMTSAVTDADGTRLLFVPYSERPPAPASPVQTPFHARHLHSGLASTVMQGALEPGGEQRLVAQRSVDGQGLKLDRVLVVGISRKVAAVAAPWRRLAWEYALAWTTLAILGSIALYLWQRRRCWARAIEAAQQAERSAAADRIELALGGADLGLWDWRIDRDRFVVDARGWAMLGFTAAEAGVLRNDWIEQVHPDDRAAVEQALCPTGTAGNAFDIEYRLRHRCGYWVWTLSRGKVVERDAAGSPVRLVGTRMDISVRKQSEAEIAHLAFHDGLTGLPNRRLLLDRLTQALAKTERNKNFGAVLFLDLDNFKRLNDTLGHHMGDHLLKRVAMRLKEATRDVDTVSRLGGDEFVVLLEGLGSIADEARVHAGIVADKIVRALGLAYQIDGHEVRCTPSVGIAMFDAHTRTVDKLLKQGDMAMYEAKAGGRNGYRFFDPAVQASADRAALLEIELRHALAAQQFVLFYQPLVDRHNALVGVEALIRWQHPQRGWVSPCEFIGQAEKSELIVDIGNWVLAVACRQLAAWSRSPRTEHLTIAVNISARQARQPNFVQQIRDIVEASGARPSRLKLELTESLLLENVDEMIARMNALKAFGVGFALDDFGTGYSSLSYLERLPIAQLKIDRSFVRDMLDTVNAATIVRAVITLAENLGLEVVAEGVETEPQRQRLLEYGCDRFQGFLFSAPLPLEQLDRWLPTAARVALVV